MATRSLTRKFIEIRAANRPLGLDGVPLIKRAEKEEASDSGLLGKVFITC